MTEAELQPVKLPPEPKLLVIDIETTPLTLYGWKIWEETFGLEQIKDDWTIMSYAAKWIGKSEVIYASTGGRGVGKVRDDSILMPGLWNLMNDADIVVAQNGVRFDIRKINYRLAFHKYTPYSPIKTIDTMLVSRRVFAATSHKLGFLSEKLTDSPKSKHRKFPGFELWDECLKDNPAAWAELKKYNVQDIRSTEKLYIKQRPWIPNHPNIGAYDPKIGGVCSKCSSKKLKEDGTVTLTSGVYTRYHCGACGGWSRGKILLNSLEQRRAMVVS